MPDDGHLFERLMTNDNLHRSNHMSPTNDVTKMVFFAAPAALMTVNLEDINKAQAARRATSDKLNEKAPEVRKEYNELRSRLYQLTAFAKDAEIYCNTQADLVKHLEQQITVQLLTKKKAEADGNLRFERTLEHGIIQWESELLDAKLEFQRAKTQSSRAGAALKAFDGYAEIKRLKAQLAL
jgi:hypothetical protein